MKSEIMRYIRSKKGKKVGVLVAQEILSGDRPIVQIGWSLCRSSDKFDREYGMQQARNHLGDPMPNSIVYAAKAFRVQCFLYFKNDPYIHDIKVMEYIHTIKQEWQTGGRIHRSHGHRIGCMFPQDPCICKSLAKSGRPFQVQAKSKVKGAQSGATVLSEFVGA
jgi:hypothetical protein